MQEVPIIEPYPDKDERVFGYRVARSSLATVPFVGAQLTELVDACIGQPLIKRRDLWFSRLHEVLLDVQQKVENFQPENLAKDEEFITTVSRATDLVLKNNREDKIVAAENIVFNSATGLKLDEVLRDTFFGLLDRFSPLHLKFLKVLNAPMENSLYANAVNSISAGAVVHGLEKVFPDLEGSTRTEILHDLKAAELSSGNENTVMTGNGLRSSFTTERGKTFIRFISR